MAPAGGELARNETRSLARSLDVVHTDRETYEQTNGGREADRESERHVQKHTLTVRDRGGGGDTQDVGGCCEAVIKSQGTDIESAASSKDVERRPGARQ